MPLSTRLPGIQFDVVAPPATVALVRMDIAVFVGLAASGPLQTPVWVEDIARFEEVFGEDLPIAADPATNQQVYAILPSAVRAFFRNGGKRCWVVRVAGSLASANRLPIPGLFALQDGALVQAYAHARSEGSWSDNIAVGAALRSDAFEVLSFSDSPLSLQLRLSSRDDVIPGDLLRVSFADPGDVLWLFVDGIAPGTQSSPPLGSSAGLTMNVTGKDFYWPLNSPPSRPSALPVCERLSMDLFVQSGTNLYSLTELGLAPWHPRYWAGLPSDIELYTADKLTDLWAEATHPRFPLAGEDISGLYVPFGVGALPQAFAGPDLTDAADAIVRDGVSEFGAGLFLDPALADSSATDLQQEADYIRYQSRQPRNLMGIHAALAIDEATIIAVPDAVQRGWSEADNAPLGAPPDSSPLLHPEWWHFLDCREQQPVPRVPAPRLDEFQPRDMLIVQAPLLELSRTEAGKYELSWTSTQATDAYSDFLEEAVEPGFVTAEVIYQGASGHYTIYGRPAGNYFYRVRRQVRSFTSDYSNGIAVRVESVSDWQVTPAKLYSNQTLLSVHCALLRMCGARGDMFAVLALPQHYRESDAAAHAAKLKSSLPGSEQTACGFGALYHPWLIGREENDLLNLRANPPDGAMAGIMALRSRQRGPWISPANEPLHGVVDMIPAVPRSSRQMLQDSLINLVRQEPNGFLCLCQLTLSDDPDYSPINVRRLLSFLRKTALRAGSEYVFEPNGDEFRRAVQRGFETLLDSLLLLGAFAGRTASEAFQVVTDSSVNTRQAMERGEFVVELRVAPSLPMRFLTVRLLQTADRTFVTEGGA
jgi:hypothetical protein